MFGRKNKNPIPNRQSGPRQSNIRQPELRRPGVRQSNNPESNSVFSYYSNRSGASQNVGRLTQNVKKSFHWKFIPSFIALAAIVISGVYATTLETYPRLAQSTVSSTLLQPDTVYQTAAQKLLQKSIFNHSKLLIDTKSIEDQLLAQFPEISSASLTIPLTSRRPILAMQPVSPKFMLQTPRGAYVIDNRGRAILQPGTGHSYSELHLPAVQDESGLEVKVGSAVLPAPNVAFIEELNHQLQAKSVAVDYFQLPKVSNEVYVHLKGQPYYVKFNLMGDARVQAGTFLAVRDKLAAEKTTPAEYIDVRVEDKAFYK